MDPRPRRLPDGSLHDIDERGDVVIGHRLAITDGLHERVVDHRGVGTTGGCIFGGHDSELGLRLCRQELDLEVATEATGVGEHRRHLRQRVPIDHCHSSTASRAGPVPTMRTGTPTSASTSATNSAAFGGRSLRVRTVEMSHSQPSRTA